MEVKGLTKHIIYNIINNYNFHKFCCVTKNEFFRGYFKGIG